MRKLRILLSTALASGILFAGLAVPSHADTAIVSTFDGAYAAGDKLAGYTTSASVLPGEALKLRVRSTGEWSVKIVRIGSYVGGDGRVVDSLGTQAAVSQPECTTSAKTFMVECPWNDTLSFATGTWPTGLYVAKLESADGYAVAPFVVRSANATGTTLFKFGILSLTAYNQFGSHNAYLGPNRESTKKSTVTSMDRPLDAWGLKTFKEFEYTVAKAVDRNLPNASWATDVDVHSGAISLAGVRSIVTSGHDEYWTIPERNAVERAMASGTNLFITGANSIYWRVRVQNSATGANRQVAIYKTAKKDPVKNSKNTTVRWRGAPKANPESRISGTMYYHSYDYCRNQNFDWVVSDPSWWGYANTRTTAGSRIPGLVGREVDQIVRKYEIPRTTQIVSHIGFTCSYSGGTKKKAHDATYTTNKAGGGVFAVGTQMWACAMNGECVGQGTNEVTNAFTKQVSDNVIQRFDQGPVGLTSPSVNNVKNFYKKKMKYVKK
jgi:hypothetical protein